jgi:hypothetical protein
MTFIPQWATALDLDFTTLPNQSLAVDTTFTVGTSPIFGTGLVWTKVNSASDATAMTITNGTGLVITPNSASNISGSTFSAPALRIQLNSIIPNWTVFMPFRIWIWESASNQTANNDRLFFGTYIPNAGFQNQFTLGHWRGFSGAANGWGSQFTVLNSDVTNTGTSIPLSSNRVGIMYCPMGVIGGSAPLLVGSTVTVVSTTIAAGSNGAVLPQSTINVVSTAGFATRGVINVTTNAGSQAVSYTGITGTTFTGCTGGTGTMSTGGFVSFGTWPTLNSLTMCNAAAITSAASAAISSTSSGAHTVTENNLFLSAFRNGSGTAFSATIARIRVDYLPSFN